MVLKYEPGASAWYCAHEPACRASISAQALVLTGVSPKYSACRAWTFGVLTYAVHRYAQFGCVAFVASIQVSPQPVAPLIGGRCCLRSATVASNCFWVSSYGSLMPRLGCDLLK